MFLRNKNSHTTLLREKSEQFNFFALYYFHIKKVVFENKNISEKDV